MRENPNEAGGGRVIYKGRAIDLILLAAKTYIYTSNLCNEYGGFKEDFPKVR
jgi:hypothetical protein